MNTNIKYRGKFYSQIFKKITLQNEIKIYNLKSDIEYRIKKYIEERFKSFKFEHKDLNYKDSLKHQPKKPRQNNHCYVTLDELYSGKEFINTIKLS